MYEALLNQIRDQEIDVGIIGLGYVGLPLAQDILKNGYRVTGFDIDANKINQLKEGNSYIQNVPSSFLQHQLNNDRFRPTDNFSHLSEMDIILICVPTPLDDDQSPDTRFIEQTAEDISQYLTSRQLVILESTTYPGTTRNLLTPILEESGLEASSDFWVAYSPEREDPGNEEYSMENTPKVVGGIDPVSTLLAREFYQQICVGVVSVENSKIAEATKLLENIYRSVNIALVNELKTIFSEMDIDIWKVIEAASTKPFGFEPFYPGPGLGGHCIPIDPFYLAWKAEQSGKEARLINLAGEINTSMPTFIVRRITKYFEDNNRSMDDLRGIILGMAYKKDIDDTRKSPSLKLMQLLEEEGVQTDYHDPYIPKIPDTREYDFDKASVSNYPEVLQQYDFVLISTDHSCYDPDEILRHSNVIFDSRNKMRDSEIVSDNVIFV